MVNTKRQNEAEALLRDALTRRVLVLDGAMGTMVQRHELTEADFRGERFRTHPSDLRGNNDLLVLTRPDVIEGIHRAFLEAGADIIETNTFNAQRLSQADYGLEDLSYELNVEAAKLARRVADEVEASDPTRPRFVAGAVGPTNRTLSLSPDVNDPGYRAVTYDEVRAIYDEQVRGLLDGGVDALLVETVFDTLNAKAALHAIEDVFEARGARVPVLVSVTITDASGRTLSGQTLEAFWISIRHARPLVVGINCALGANEMRPWVEELSRIADCFTSCYPNAGLPNAFGAYDETAAEFAAAVGTFLDAGWVNLIGGCCGTTPEHVRAVASRISEWAPRVPPPRSPLTWLSGLEPLAFRPESGFLMVGERTNVTGSRRFARLIKSGDHEEALSIARQQVEGGANILDVNMDEGMLDSVEEMGRFLRLIASEPDIARIPIMIDSSRFEVLEEGLKNVQGRAVVNSLSLKEGEDEFRRQARLVRRYGAAVLVMAFDEEGQAVDTERRLEIAERVHRILIDEVGFEPTDIFFDPNILAIATGMEEHDDYGVAFIESTRRIKARWPATKISGGVSNLSFSFRGNETVREAMHAVFLFHAIRAGMDLGIVNAGQLAVVEEVEPELRQRIEDVVLNRRADATERLITYAESVGARAKTAVEVAAWRQEDVAGRLRHALVHGVVDHVDADCEEALAALGSALAVIEGPLMAGMQVVGDLFGAGKMFLPQVVKSARVMKKAVAWLEPYMHTSGGVAETRGRVLLATVKGDVHDIGKNIVSVVLACNNYEIEDMGVMVPADRILRRAREINADIVGLSGLITPSLDEMVHVAREMQREGFTVPLLIGGATTSRRHTSVKIAPAYEGPVVHVVDASRAVGVVGGLLGRDAAIYVADVRAQQEEDRVKHRDRARVELVSLDRARANALVTDWTAEPPRTPSVRGLMDVAPTVAELRPWIDWTPFFATWELRGTYPKILDHPTMGESARDVYAAAHRLLDDLERSGELAPRGVWGMFPAGADGDDIVVWEDDSRQRERARLLTLRQQIAREGERANLALADYVAPVTSGARDWIGLFAVTAGHGMEALTERCARDYDAFGGILAQAVADRLAEAFAEWVHAEARVAWGIESRGAWTIEEMIAESYQGIRPAPGYPACPDHLEKRTLFGLLEAESRAGMSLTESMAMLPTAAVAGYLIGHPASRYFSVTSIAADQVESWARRRGVSVREAERWLAPVLAYDP